MKIRIKGNSLRYRLTRSEVERFAAEGYIDDSASFGPTQLTYALKVSGDDNLRADMQNNCITFYMPSHMADEWTQTDRVGFESSTGDLYLLIEKDFMCLDLPMQDQADNYPNPLMVPLPVV